jgi:hypothetical protein
MNKVTARVILFTALAGLLIILISRNRVPFGRGNSSFGCGPDKEITRIELNDGAGRIYLVREGERWLLNGKIETRKPAIHFVEMILRDMKIKSPVSDELFKKEISGKNVTPVRVRVYERSRLLRSFLVYKTPSNLYGNIMKMRERSKPFIVYVPGYEVNIGAVFTAKELYWQPYLVFNLLPSEIESVNLENISDTASSYTIANHSNEFMICDMNGRLTGADTGRIKRYISYFAWIPFEEWAFELSGQEVAETRQPLYRITVSCRNGTTKSLSLWEKYRTENGIRVKDTDRLLGKTDERDELFIVRYYDIDPILKKRSYFFGE